MRKFILLPSILFILTLFITGCYDKRELEKQSYVIAIGVDQAEEEHKYSVTFQIANPEAGSLITGGGTQEKPRETITIVANDLITAANTANSIVTKEITLDHTKVIVVSEELARSGEMIRFMQSTTRTTQIRPGVQLVVSKEKAETFLNNNHPTLESRPHKYYQFMLHRAKETGNIPESDFHRFFQITEGDAGLFLAIYATSEKEDYKESGKEDELIAGEIPAKGENPVEFMGSAVLKEGKMIDVLSGQATRLANVFDVTTNMNDLASTYKDPLAEEYDISASYVQRREPEVNITYHKDKPTVIDVNVPFSIEVLAIPSLVNYAESKEKQKILKDSIEKSLEKKSRELIKKTQEEYGTDPFYWSLFVRKNFLTIKEYEEANWNKKIYPNAEINVNFELNMIEFGKMIKDTNLSELRD
ncbi:Ger(x)C family spore germination protein [Radiobacillus kanasensis]|uniref:Ger(x)C family spore germination protein n=1 Tax=Radiobacillus kanasensis TaxID=2844358 RepID=UPI001E2D5C2E|nr:Ger(x)C family spore germination protein [Radiobacillus kanasensis]UFT99448.1 Ger(x)C family spore germination protein [Radiobacillus kanasensis]